jgi:hypothetical protein
MPAPPITALRSADRQAAGSGAGWTDDSKRGARSEDRSTLSQFEDSTPSVAIPESGNVVGRIAGTIAGTVAIPAVGTNISAVATMAVAIVPPVGESRKPRGRGQPAGHGWGPPSAAAPPTGTRAERATMEAATVGASAAVPMRSRCRFGRACSKGQAAD